MKLWQTALAVGIAGTVAYVGYRVVKRASLEGPSIDESEALKPQDAPIPVSEQVKVVSKGARPSLDMRVSRDIPLLRGDIASRFSMRDSEPPSFMPILPVDTRTANQRLAAIMREGNTPAEYDIFGNRTR